MTQLQEEVAACIECDHAGQGSPYQRQDGTWRCHECGAEFAKPKRRESERGSNLTPELCRKGARNGPTPSAEFMRRIAQKPKVDAIGGRDRNDSN